jgi:hypothetical protein
MISFGTRQGAAFIIRIVFDRKPSKMFMLDVDVEPPELYAVGPDGSQYHLIDEYFVVAI